MKRLLLAAAVSCVAAGLTATPAAAITFSYTGAIETWTVPDAGLWEIVALGAAGGGNEATLEFSGAGARIGGRFDLPAGTMLQIAVGGQGARGYHGGGGGGGSFVVGPGDAPLVIAGGGGGVNIDGSGIFIRNASTGQAGISGRFVGSLIGAPLLGSIGQGGPALPAVGGGDGGGGGGGGFGSSGGDVGASSTGGDGWTALLAGGQDLGTCPNLPPGYARAHGGFGGGGGGSSCDGGYSGGGGGYSGGGGGFGGGGGGSFNADLVTGFAQGNASFGNGSVTITLIEQAVPTPEPASAALAVLGLFALAAVRRRK
jgi:MYXO-CTERM domain-containing protein